MAGCLARHLSRGVPDMHDHTAEETTNRTTDPDLYGAIVTHTTATILGKQKAQINIHAALTDEAQMIVTFGRVMMTFRSAAAVAGFFAGFADARHLIGQVDNQAPRPGGPGDHFGRVAMSVVWLAAPECAAVKQERYIPARRRTMRWVEVHMGPVTWRIIDRVGYMTMIEELRTVHRTAIAVFLDGPEHASDPTAYGAPDAFDDAEREAREDPARWRLLK